MRTRDPRLGAVAILTAELLAMFGAYQLVEGSFLLGTALMAVAVVTWSLVSPRETRGPRRVRHTENEADRLQRRRTSG